MGFEFSRRNLFKASASAVPAALFPGLACRSGDPTNSRAAAKESSTDVRSVLEVIAAQASMDGAGVKLSRSLGSRALPMLDPFLLLDEIKSDVPSEYKNGFPSHPHRGFETVTYMIEGAFEHRDSVGNQGRLSAGSAQWMTAGRGIVHSEMPKQDSGLLWGLQLWVNLPRADKMTAPRYQDIPPDRIATLSVDGARVRLVAGSLQGETGPVSAIAVEPTLLDITLGKRGEFEQPLPSAHTAFVFVLEGSVQLGGTLAPITRGNLAVLSAGSVAVMKTEPGARVLLVAGRPLKEPVARRGPFVMNTEAELTQAFEDYRSGRLTRG